MRKGRRGNGNLLLTGDFVGGDAGCFCEEGVAFASGEA